MVAPFVILVATQAILLVPVGLIQRGHHLRVLFVGRLVIFHVSALLGLRVVQGRVYRMRAFRGAPLQIKLMGIIQALRLAHQTECGG